MQKQLFISQIKQNLAKLQPFSTQVVTIDNPYFSHKSGLVRFFIAEIEQTLNALVHQEEVLYTEFYAEKLVKQFDALNKAVEKQQKNTKKTVQFHSSFQFPANIHRLSPAKRLEEYRKALRALNEKISWLIEQLYNAEQEGLKQVLQNSITETEYRKTKCLKAIENLEQQLQFK
ncbi:primosomal replication protein [Mannheimia sp. AT1]|uniref:Primosomal replication protein n=1 Tax=Mannheimia cairinae TaxID=3025936 RepID=A0ABT5MKZ9_9PAST|nr:primosomal replication protein PriC [Mannheimia cairinae]MDD0822867.1 primosomal replication protein [Mannheimia cairinae]MDD0826105.1 primosomal replication protein [Mannheimia cairinae]